MSTKTQQLKVGGVPEHFNYPWLQAVQSPEFASSVEWFDQPGGTGEMIGRLKAGELDIASILTEGIISAIRGGLEATILQVYVESPLQWGVFVPHSSSIMAESDLTQPRIAISRFQSGSHLMAYIFAKENGLEIKDDQFVVVGDLVGAVDAFASGHCELFLWEQHMASPFVEAGDFRQIGVQKTPWPSFVIAVRNEILQARTTEVGQLVDAVVAEAQKFNGNGLSAALVKEMASTYKISDKMLARWAEHTKYASRGAFAPALADDVVETLRKAGFG